MYVINPDDDGDAVDRRATKQDKRINAALRKMDSSVNTDEAQEVDQLMAQKRNLQRGLPLDAKLLLKLRPKYAAHMGEFPTDAELRKQIRNT